jgi:hypothetical protein
VPGAVRFTKGDDGLAAERKIGILRITNRESAPVFGDREKFLGGRIRLDKRGSSVIGTVAFVVRLTRCGLGLWRATVYQSSRLDLTDRDHASGKKAGEDCDSERHPPLSATPPAQVPRRSAQHPRDALLRDAERTKSRAGVARE